MSSFYPWPVPHLISLPPPLPPPQSPPPQADATYLIVNTEGSIEKYGLNAVCTHLGCVVPWNKAENKVGGWGRTSRILCTAVCDSAFSFCWSRR
jgi:hypothetical protein